MRKDKVSAVMVRVENDTNIGIKVQNDLFMGMDPFRCRVFADGVENPPPVLRMVFALASSRSIVSVPSRGPQNARNEAEQKALKAHFSKKLFTAYDIWCAGAFHDTFDVIAEDEEGVFARLLETIRHSRDIPVMDPEELCVLRQAQPLVGAHPDHRMWKARREVEIPLRPDGDIDEMDDSAE